MSENELAVMVKSELTKIHADVNRGLESSKQKQGELQAQLLDLQQKAARRGPGGGAADTGVSLGASVAEAFNASDARELLKRTGRLSLEIAASITTTNSGGSHGNLAVPGAPLIASTSLSALMTAGALDGLTTLNYSRRVSTVGGAAVQAGEGATKASAEPTFTPIATNAATVAGTCVISEQAMNANGGLARAVNGHLSKSVRDAVDLLLLTGTAVAAWPFVGYRALAQTLTAGAGFKSLVDAVIVAATRMKLQGFAPGIVVMGEGGFLQTQLERGEDLHYINASNKLRDAGLRVALSSAVGDAEALLLDEQFVGFLSSGATRISVGTIDSQFAQNLLTCRAETEVLAYVSDYQAAMLVTPSAT